MQGDTYIHPAESKNAGLSLCREADVTDGYASFYPSCRSFNNTQTVRFTHPAGNSITLRP
jgi:hypothetical protein